MTCVGSKRSLAVPVSPTEINNDTWRSVGNGESVFVFNDRTSTRNVE